MPPATGGHAYITPHYFPQPEAKPGYRPLDTRRIVSMDLRQMNDYFHFIFRPFDLWYFAHFKSLFFNLAMRSYLVDRMAEGKTPSPSLMPRNPAFYFALQGQGQRQELQHHPQH